MQFGGAVGTLASLGTAGGAISAELARLLNLAEPELPWHTQRDRLVAMVQALAILTGTLAKFGRDVALLMQAEVGEVSEGAGEGRGSSSTMPHKHNPVASAALIAIHAKMPGLAATLLYAMPQEHERGPGLWQAEWDTVPEAFCLASASVAYAIEIAEGLQGGCGTHAGEHGGDVGIADVGGGECGPCAQDGTACGPRSSSQGCGSSADGESPVIRCIEADARGEGAVERHGDR